MKLMVPAEQALSMTMAAAAAMGEADAGSAEAAEVLRILTPLVKFRACRDNVTVATGAMEVRGGNGYIEEWVNAAPGARRPDRPAVGGHQQHQRARRDRPRRRQEQGAQARWRRCCAAACRRSSGLPAAFTGRLESALARALEFAERVAREPASEPQARRASSALYHAASAVLLAWEGTRDRADARRALLARFVLEHRLSAQGPARARGGRLGSARHRGAAGGCSRAAARAAAFLAA